MSNNLIYALSKYILLGLFFLLMGCVNSVVYKGYARSMVKLWDDVKVGDTQEEVLNLLGSPTIFSAADNNTWYYVSSAVYEKKFSSKRYSSQSLKITFDYDTKKVVGVDQVITSPKRLIHFERVRYKIGDINDHMLRKLGDILTRKSKMK